MSSTQIKKVTFCTIGCKLNFAETSAMSLFFKNHNWDIVNFNVIADCYVINTCSVTANADKKTRNLIRRCISKNSSAIIIVTGCYVQLNLLELLNSFVGIDYILANNYKSYLNDLIPTLSKQSTPLYKVDSNCFSFEYFPSVAIGNRTRAFIKVQDGCDYFCSYCTVPYARGQSRNSKISNIINQVENIISQGAKEIILTGVNIGDFGKSTNESFFDLLQSLSSIKDLPRIRIGSIEPNLLTESIIELIAEHNNILPHFHIPLQTGCDTLLNMMKRRYDTVLFRSRVEYIRQLLPDAFIGIDLIVGLNGETESYFQDTVNFLEQLDISYIHHFSYSERKNTPAITFLPQVSYAEKQSRSSIISELSNKKHNLFLKSQIGKEFNVLFESSCTKKSRYIYGLTDNYIHVVTDYNIDYINQIIRAKIIDFVDNETMQIKILP